MNIFALDLDPVKCAEYHNSKHTIKMILEHNQLLSTAHRVLDGSEIVVKSKTNRNVKRWVLPDVRENILYSATHVNHPSAIWCRQSKSNYMWLVELTDALCKEYTYRYGKIHKCESIGLVELLKTPPQNIINKPFTQPTPAMPDECKVTGDSIASYRNYYKMNKTHLANWDGKINSRNTPHWYNKTEEK
jgi:hypothetical protein